MFTPRQHKSAVLYLLRWTARLLSAVFIGLILLFLFGVSFDMSKITWQDIVGLTLFPFGLVAGLILGWKEELKGGSLAVGSVAAFYLIYGYVLSGSFRLGWWFAVFSIPGLLFLTYGLITRHASAQQIRTLAV